MSLKNRNRFSWLCGILAAFFFSVRLVIIETAVFQNSIAETTTFQVSQTVSTKENETETIRLPEITTRFSFEEFTEITVLNDSYKNQNQNNNKNQQERPVMVSSVLLIIGLILAGFFIFAMRQERLYLGLEAVLLCCSLCMIGIRQPMPIHQARFFWIGSFWILFFLLLVSLRGLWAWIRNRCPFDWSIAHRLGKRLVGSSGKQSRYLLVQFGVSILTLAGSILIFFLMQDSFERWIWGVDCWIIGGTSLSGFIRLAYDMEHLSEQIRSLQEGTLLGIRDGVFSEDEEKLMEFYRQRDEAIDTAVTSERFKVELIANVSHDLRTPLTAILGYGELLKTESLSLNGRKQLEELNQKAGYMRELVDSLFELTKVSSGVVKSKKEPIDLIRLLEQTIGLLDDQLKEHHLSVRRHYEADSVLIVTDGMRMHQVFANLLGNAIKYSLKETRIHLEVKNGEQTVIIRMTNIASYEMNFDAKKILQRFARGDQARTTKGSGLGLAIAQTYTESVGGTFEVQIDSEQFSAIVKLPKIEHEK